MTDASDQVDTSAARAYEHDLVPSLFAPWVEDVIQFGLDQRRDVHAVDEGFWNSPRHPALVRVLPMS